MGEKFSPTLEKLLPPINQIHRRIQLFQSYQRLLPGHLNFGKVTTTREPNPPLASNFSKVTNA